jgi:hypothetical protein
VRKAKRRTAKISRPRITNRESGKQKRMRKLKRYTPSGRRRARATLMAPRQAAVRAQETAFHLLTSVDRGGIIHNFLRWYASERKRPGRIANPGRYHELVEMIRRESFLVLVMQIEADAPQRFGARSLEKMTSAQTELINLFRKEFYVAIGRSLDFSNEEFSDFCRDLDLYRSLLHHARSSHPQVKPLSAPTGPFVDRCGFLLDSPMLDEGRRAAAKFESELRALASSVIRKVFSRRSYR